MSRNIVKRAKIYLKSIGFNNILNFKEIKEGRNSNVFRFKANNRDLVLKIYKFKSKNRIKRESLFYKFLTENKSKQSLIPINFSINNNMAVFPYIDGFKIKKIKNAHIKEATNFINYINKNKVLENLPLAIDGIKNRKIHLSLCEKNINKIKKIKTIPSIKKDFLIFLEKKLIPKYKEIKEVFNSLNKKYLPKMNLTKNQMIISPSDFGFHNAIKNNKKLFFIDFEYAGFDDPIKLICDFYCQPDQSLTVKQKEIFIRKLILKGYKLNQLKSYIKIYLPFHIIKWCCIMLKELEYNKAFNHFKNKKSYSQSVKNKLIKTEMYFRKNF